MRHTEEKNQRTQNKQKYIISWNLDGHIKQQIRKKIDKKLPRMQHKTQRTGKYKKHGGPETNIK